MSEEKGSKVNDIKEEAQETKKDVEGVSKLAGSAATGNVAGTALEGAKLAGRKVKSFIKNPKKVIKKIAIRIAIKIIPIIAVIMIPIMIYMAIIESTKSFVTALKDMWLNMVKTDSYIAMDDEVLKVIRQVEALGINMSDLGIAESSDDENEDPIKLTDPTEKITKEEKAAIKYFREFIKANMATKLIDANNTNLVAKMVEAYTNQVIKTPYLGSLNMFAMSKYIGIDGCIKLYRDDASSSDEKIQLEMTNELDQYKGDKKYYKYFSIDENNNILVLVNTGDTIEIQTIPYEDAVSQHEVPIMFFVDMCMVTQNPKYVKALAKDIIKNTEIDIVLQENVTEITEEVKTTAPVYSSSTSGSSGAITTTQPIYSGYDTSTVKKTQTIKTIVPYISKVDALLYKAEQSYERDTPQSNFSSNSDVIQGADGHDTTIETTTTVTTYGFKNEDTPKVEAKYGKDASGNEYDFPKYTKKTYSIPASGTSARAYDSLKDGGEILFELMDTNLDNDFLEQILKYVLYKMTNHDFGVTKLDESLFELGEFSTFGTTGNLSVSTITISKEDFVKAVKEYRTDKKYQDKLAVYAEQIYDICTKNNVNPVLCVAQAGKESSFGENVPSKSPYNYWGLGVVNNSNQGIEYNNMDGAIEGYCKIILNQQKDYAVTRSKEFATCNNHFTANMSTIYDSLSAYAFLGSTHDSKMWKGVNAKQFIEKYLTDISCNHNIGDATTLEEQAAYSVWYVDCVITTAKEIFGDKIFDVTGGVIAEGNRSLGYSGIYRNAKTGMEYKEYKQSWGPWAGLKYDVGSIGTKGCNVTADAIIISGYDKNVTPTNVRGGQTRISTDGRLRDYGLSVVRKSGNRQELIKHLTSGKTAIIHVNSASSYTKSGHWMAILDINSDSSQVYLSNPSSSGTGWQSTDKVLVGLIEVIYINN